MTHSTSARLLLRTLALVYFGALVLVPVGVILYRTFEPGFGEFWAFITTPAAQHAVLLTLLIVALTVPLTVVFGLFVAMTLARGRSRWRRVLDVVVDLPFAVSPIVVGVALMALWGYSGWFGGVERLGITVVFGIPGMVLATVFVTLPFVVREVEPVLREVGLEQEEAARMLGATPWQVLVSITLPSIRWALVYGIVLTVARALGEFGAVLMVSSNFPGVSQTLTLLVHSRYIDDFNEYGSYAASTVLMALSTTVLVVMTVLNRRR